jgi:hypothetical protein
MQATNEIAPPPRSLFVKLFVRSSWEYRSRFFWGLRFVSGLVQLGVGILVLSYGSWWALPFLAASAANFFVGYRIYRITQNQPPT